MSGNSKKIIAFNYFGGKFTYTDDIYPYFPVDFAHMIELFAGSAALSLNYKPNRPLVRTINELNGDVTNFFEVLRDQHEILIEKLLLTPASEQEYLNAWEYSEDDVERARRFYVRARQSFFGLGAQRKNKGWHMAKSKANANGGETVSRWNNSIPKLMQIAEMIATNFQILNDDFKNALERLDSKEAFIYCDPPYLLESRVSSKDYKHEFDRDQHIDLGKMLNQIKGRAMISSYDNDLYKEIYSEWTMIKLPKKMNGIRSKEQQECIWFNYPIEETEKYKLEQDLKKYGTVTKLKFK